MSVKSRNSKIHVTGKPSKSKDKLSENRSQKTGFRRLPNLSGVLKFARNVSQDNQNKFYEFENFRFSNVFFIILMISWLSLLWISLGDFFDVKNCVQFFSFVCRPPECVIFHSFVRIYFLSGVKYF